LQQLKFWCKLTAFTHCAALLTPFFGSTNVTISYTNIVRVEQCGLPNYTLIDFIELDSRKKILYVRNAN